MPSAHAHLRKNHPQVQRHDLQENSIYPKNRVWIGSALAAQGYGNDQSAIVPRAVIQPCAVQNSQYAHQDERCAPRQRGQVAHQCFDQGRFSGTIGTKQPNTVSRLKSKINTMKNHGRLRRCCRMDINRWRIGGCRRKQYRITAIHLAQRNQECGCLVGGANVTRNSRSIRTASVPANFSKRLIRLCACLTFDALALKRSMKLCK